MSRSSQLTNLTRNFQHRARRRVPKTHANRCVYQITFSGTRHDTNYFNGIFLAQRDKASSAKGDDLKPKGSLARGRAVVRGILEHVLRCPEAKDTSTGVQQWWLPSELRSTELIVIERMLDLLVRRGWLNAKGTGLTGKFYSLKRRKIQEIKSYLKGENDAPPKRKAGILPRSFD